MSLRITKIDPKFCLSMEIDTQLDLTGLSGVSELVAELVAQGQVDTEEAGLSQRDLEKLTHKARLT